MRNMKKMFVTILAVAALAVTPLYAGSSSDESVMAEVSDEVRDTLKHLEIRSALINHFGTDALAIDVGVESDIVVLEGEVAERATQELSEEVAKSVDGITEVHNRLKLTSGEPDTAGEILSNAELETRDAYLETKVKGELTSNIGDEAFDVTVEAVNGVVSLRGNLPDDERRTIAIRTTKDVSGVERVIDLLEVTS